MATGPASAGPAMPHAQDPRWSRSFSGRVEHRLFSFISINWRGRPLTDYQVIVETIAATRTQTGLTGEAVLDTNGYPTGLKVSDAELKAVPITRDVIHGAWNDTIHSGPT